MLAGKKAEFVNPDEEKVAQALARDGLEDGMEKLQMSTLVSEYLKVQDLKVVPEKSMQLAVENFVDKGDRDAIAK